ncbi:NAD-dependent epimerase/dehydratase family protein [Candidatus Neomarinimicrobiota bacterium]
MHVFLTGATGFIGKNLIPYLLERNCTLACLVRDPRRLPEDLKSKVRIIIGELDNLGPDVQNDLESADVVVHLAGQPWGRTYRDFNRVNCEGTRDLIDAVQTAGAPLKRFVYMSTLSAAGPSSLGIPRTEEDPEEPMSWYGQSKLAGEKVFADASFPWTILRPPTVYGPWDQDVKRFFKLANWHLRPYLLGGPFELSLVHVNDVCQAVWLVMSKENLPQSIYYLNDGQPIYQFNDVTDEIMKAIGKWHIVMPVPWGATWLAEKILALGMKIGLVPLRLTADKLREIRRHAWTCSADLIASRLNFKPEFTLRMGIDLTVQWYQANQWQ